MTSLSDPPTRRNDKSRDKAKALRQTIDDRVEQLAKAVDDVRASELFREYLNMQSRFHRYSWHNAMLIMSQKPDAERVAGFKTWQTMGRHVRKGERGIMIFAPRPWKHTDTDDAGNDTERQGVTFRPVYVFDVSQTDGEPLPEIDVPDVDTAADTLLASLGRVASKRGIAVNYTSLEPGYFGVSKGGSIDIAKDHATGQQAKTLAHELAHESLHKGEKRQGLTRSAAELEAESVAYVVCRHFSLDTEVRSSAYIALWDGNAKALRESLERIATTARDIIDDVDALASGKAVA